MSLSPEVIDAMVANGASAEMLAAVMKAELATIAKQRAEAEAAILARRASAAEKKRRQRAQHVPACPDLSPGHVGTSLDIEGRPETPPETKVSPTPPSKTQTPKFTPPVVPPVFDGSQLVLPPAGTAKAKSRSRADAPPTDAELARFEAWWGVWQNRVARQAAIPAFVRAIRSGVTDAVLIAASQRYFAALKVSGYSAAHPATWLNGRRWEDEVECPVSADGTTPDRWRLMVQFFAEGTDWPAAHGPAPGSPGCRAPPDILAEFGFADPARRSAA